MSEISNLFIHRLYDKMVDTKRWNGHPVIHAESVAEHSYLVAYCTSVMLQEIGIADLQHMQAQCFTVLNYALFHDLDEVFTGDILHTMKHCPNGTIIQNFLKDYAKNHTPNFPSWMMPGTEATTTMPVWCKYMAKVADWLSMVWYSFREMESGNSKFKEIAEYCVASCIEAMIKMSKSLFMSLELDMYERMRGLVKSWMLELEEQHTQCNYASDKIRSSSQEYNY